MTSQRKGADLQSLMEIDRLVHEPARLAVLSQLYVLENADFIFLLNRTGLTQGNLSSHLTRLEAEGYVEVQKKFIGRKPHTLVCMTAQGRRNFKTYIGNMKQLFDSLNQL